MTHSTTLRAGHAAALAVHDNTCTLVLGQVLEATNVVEKQSHK